MDEVSCGLELEVNESRASRGVVNSYSFVLSSTKRELYLSDFTKIQLDYSEAGGNASTQCSNDDSHRWLYMGLA